MFDFQPANTLTEAPMAKKQDGTASMSVSELAEKAGVHRNNIIYWIKQGTIKAYRTGLAPKSPYEIPLDEAMRVISELREPDPVL